MHPPARNGWFSWTRAACLGATVALLWLAFRRIDGAAFLEALRRTDPAWSGAAFAVYGLALTAGAWRWHIALRATERLVHCLATWRLALAGHFYFTALLGVVGGDLAKSVTYARWFRFPLAEVLAAAPLDRALSLGAAILIGMLALGVALVGGGFNALSLVTWRGVAWALSGLGVAALVFVAWARWRPRGMPERCTRPMKLADSSSSSSFVLVLESPNKTGIEHENEDEGRGRSCGQSLIQNSTMGSSSAAGSWARTLRAIRAGGSRLAASPRAGGSGLLAAATAQAALSAVFALNLLAVTTAPLPWAQLAWTFPAITTLGALPFTFAGVGVREVAAVTLLGWYGVPAGDGLAASMLTVGMRLAWAAIGAGVIWREQARQGPAAGRPLPHTLSIIIPTLNEEAALPETIRHARANREICEIIVVDGGSRDDTRQLAARLGCQVISSPAGRGRQLRLGAAHASGDVVMLLHADTWLPPGGAAAALGCLRDGSVVAGGFWKVFREGSWLMKGSRLRCALRLWLGGRILGDQAMFIRRDALEQIGGVPDMALMEEFELCRRLRPIGRLALAPATVATSARRFARLGVLRTYVRMWGITLRYRLGVAPPELERMYEKD